MRTVLKFLAPYFAVGVCWFWLSNGWLAALAYHLQILLWAGLRIPLPRRPAQLRHLLWTLPAAAAGPLLYVLLPELSDGQLPQWFAEHQLSPVAMLLMIPYFGIVHPWLEQVHWKPLRERGVIAHPIFAGYHVWVLVSLTEWPWLVVVFVVLAVVSYLWGKLTTHSQSLTPAYVSHVLADVGIVAAAWLRT